MPFEKLFGQIKELWKQRKSSSLYRNVKCMFFICSSSGSQCHFGVGKERSLLTGSEVHVCWKSDLPLALYKKATLRHFSVVQARIAWNIRWNIFGTFTSNLVGAVIIWDECLTLLVGGQQYAPTAKSLVYELSRLSGVLTCHTLLNRKRDCPAAECSVDHPSPCSKCPECEENAFTVLWGKPPFGMNITQVTQIFKEKQLVNTPPPFLQLAASLPVQINRPRAYTGAWRCSCSWLANIWCLPTKISFFFQQTAPTQAQAAPGVRRPTRVSVGNRPAKDKVSDWGDS